MKTVEGFAPAKLNLTLHITGQRPDGYHLLDSLVVFADIGDRIQARAADSLSLDVIGAEAAGLKPDDDNLVLRAARFLCDQKGADLTLTKELPVSSGIGGGSSDAAATLRVLGELWSLPLPSARETLLLGADLPVCMTPVPQRMSGVGEVLQASPDLPEMAVVLINPRVAVSTPDVFSALASKTNPPMPAEFPRWDGFLDFVHWLESQRNDLQPPAVQAVHQINDVCGALTRHGAALARMSGSGATCFGLFPDLPVAKQALNTLGSENPGWWCAAGRILT